MTHCWTFDKISNFTLSAVIGMKNYDAGNLILLRNSVKWIFDAASCLARSGPTLMKCSFRMLGMYYLLLIVLLLVGCLKAFITMLRFFLGFNRLFIPSQVFFILNILSLKNLRFFFLIVLVCKFYNSNICI